MSRKDTIIVAVLVNAGLLIVLFASALKSNGPSSTALEQEFAQAPQPLHHAPSVAATKETSTLPSLPGNEVDQVFQYVAQPANASTTPSVASKTASLPSVADLPTVQPVPPVSSFASDFKMTPPAEKPLISIVEKPTHQHIEHKVKKGDVLEKIARHHQCSVDQLMKLNHLTTSNLWIGQVLKVPVKAGVAEQPVVTTTSASTDPSSIKYYTVKNGDNPWTIAVKNHMKVEELLKLNQLDEEKARRLKPGDQLKIR
jgi:peptidoglycan endopeptidase LytF